MAYELIDFDIRGDESGSLVAIEGLRNVPFDIKRVYYIYGTTSKAVRGKHAHKRLKQLIFCPIGSCEFLLDDGHESKIVRLQRPNQGLFIRSCVWREFTNFSPDCVVMVLASEHYDVEDYIYSHEEFLEFVRG